MDRQNVLKKSEDRDCRKEKGMTAGKEIMRSSRDLRLTGHARLVRARLKDWRQEALKASLHVTSEGAKGGCTGANWRLATS